MFREGESRHDVNFEAAVSDLEDHVASEDAAEERSTRHSRDRRKDRKRDSVVHRVLHKAAPPGSKRRTVGATIATTAGLATAAYGAHKAVEYVTDAGADAAYTAGSKLDTGNHEGAPYGAGVDVSQSDVEAAQAEEAADAALAEAAAEAADDDN
jgi:hypothetical protein